MGDFQNNITADNCDCPMECNSISYSFSLVSTPFNPEKVCLGDKSKGYFLMKDFYNHKSPPQYIRRLMELKDNISSNPEEVCKKKIPYRAEVIFRMATDSISVTVMSKRLSFFDKMSAFGGILGLFTGISIVSMVELVFWIIRYLMRRPCGKAHPLLEINK